MEKLKSFHSQLHSLREVNISMGSYAIRVISADQVIQFKTKMFKTLTEKYKVLKEEYLSRSPRGKWEFVRNIGIFVLTLTGVPILDPTYEVYWYSFAPFVTCTDIFISFLYTVWYYRETPLTGFLVTPLFGVVIPVNSLEKKANIIT